MYTYMYVYDLHTRRSGLSEHPKEGMLEVCEALGIEESTSKLKHTVLSIS